LEDITTGDLMQFIKGPDFPTAGLVYRHRDGAESEEDDTLLSAYATGRGKITVRAKVHIEDMGRGKSRIIVSELPYQTNKGALIERIAMLANNGRLDGLADLRDESDRQGLRLVIELQRGAEASSVLADLFRLTPLQDTFSIIMLALVDNEPRVLSLKQCLRVYLEHRLEIVERRSKYDLARAKDRAHILEGLLKALENLDEVVGIIRKSRTVETARQNLRKTLKITEIQAQAILDMPLRRLAALERKKIEDEHSEKVKLIKYLQGLLKSPKKMRELIAEELTLIKQAYTDPRRTVIVSGLAGSTSTEDLMMPEENIWVTLTVDGKLGRSYDDVPPKVTTSTKIPPRCILESSTTHTIYLFTSSGECATVPAQQLPQVEDPAQGAHLADLTPLSAEEAVIAVLSLPANLDTGYLFLVSDDGQVKRVRMEDVPGMTSKVFTMMKVADGARLGWVFPTTGSDEVILATAQGQAIRFMEDDVRPTGLPSGGMRGVKLLGQRDHVVGAAIVVNNQHFWCVTDDGVAKTSPMNEFPTQGRAGSGVIAMRLPASSKQLAAATIGRLDDNVIILTNKNKPKYMRVGLAPQVGRGRSGGDYIISMRETETVAGVVTYQQRIGTPEPAQ
jgi:DNA gyrase subunit A